MVINFEGCHFESRAEVFIMAEFKIVSVLKWKLFYLKRGLGTASGLLSNSTQEHGVFFTCGRTQLSFIHFLLSIIMMDGSSEESLFSHN